MSLSLAQKLSFRLATGWQQRTMARAVAGPVLSIGFDDAPRSAWTMGGQVLADHGVRATYYVCGGLVDTDGELGTYLTRADLRALVAAGHELGCHTFDHSSALLAGAGRFAASLEENARWLADFTGGVAPCSFAYPYCHVGLAARRAAGARFHTARAGGRAWNGPVFDPAVLAGWPLEAREGAVDYADLCQAAARAGGWLVLFSHDVSERPGPYGCTPRQLDEVLRAARRAGMAILPAGDVALVRR